MSFIGGVIRNSVAAVQTAVTQGIKGLGKEIGQAMSQALGPALGNFAQQLQGAIKAFNPGQILQSMMQQGARSGCGLPQLLQQVVGHAQQCMGKMTSGQMPARQGPEMGAQQANMLQVMKTVLAATGQAGQGTTPAAAPTARPPCDGRAAASMDHVKAVLQSVMMYRAAAMQSGASQTGGAPPSEKNVTSKPTGQTGRPPGDNRSAEQIINENPVLKNLGHQKDIKRDLLMQRCGDWTENNPDPKSRADAAFNMASVLNYINTSKNREGGDRKVDTVIDGITKDGDARRGTEAGNLKDFAEKGYGALKGNHQLDQTKDTHVRLDGSNKDNFQWAAGEVGKKLWFIPGLSNVLTGIGDSTGGFGGVLKGAAGGVGQTLKGVAEGALDALKTGRINPISMGLNMYKGALSETTAAPQAVKDLANKL